MRSHFTRARLLRFVAVVAAIALLPVAATAAVGKASPEGPGWAPALGSTVADLSALPAATESEAHVLPDSDPFTPAELKAVQTALTPGYRAASLMRSGNALAIALLYLPDASSEGVLLALRGTLGPSGVTFLAPAMAVGMVDVVGEVLEVTGLDGIVRSFNMSDPVACFFFWIVALGYVAACFFGDVFVMIFCGLTNVDQQASYGAMESDACAHAPIDVQPKNQTVGYAQRAHFTINGHNYILADREITIPFTTCSGPGCSTRQYANDEAGTSDHWFYPLIACCSPQTKTVYGTIRYDTGWKSQGVQLTVTP